MLEFIDEILSRFQSCFSRKAAFHWFVILVIGFMLRPDCLGVTSVIRGLALRENCYETMLHFFRASSWRLESLLCCWYRTVLRYAPLYKEGGRNVLIGDGVKQAKEGCFMPGVKKLVQESEDSSKPEYIFGHMFGGLGVLAGSLSKWFCIPLCFNIQDGLQPAAGWKGAAVSTASHVVQTVEKAFQAAGILGDSLLLLDRYFLSVPALKKLAELNEGSGVHVELVTKAKRSCCAYEKPPAKKPGRGRPPKKGKAVRLSGLFASCRDSFREAKVRIYGKEEDVRYYSINLLRGQKLYQELRFVLVEYKGIQSILACTDVSLDPLAVIRLYSYRFQIECTFREFKQQLGGFCYRFWTKAVPRLNRYAKKGGSHPLETVSSPSKQERIVRTVKAMEGFVQLCVISMGILQMASLKFSGDIRHSIRYMRTPTKEAVSEATLMDYFRQHFFRVLAQKPGLLITKIIKKQQDEPEIYDSLWVS